MNFRPRWIRLLPPSLPNCCEQHRNSGVDDSSAIFVLGLPRSGSTLQEQILASHSQVEGTRELPYIPWIAQRLNRKPNPHVPRQLPSGGSAVRG